MSRPAEDEQEYAEWLERGRILFTGIIDFALGVAKISGLPEADRLEIAFAGRSNVGKSSLINALCNRKALARTSNTPGRTKELNFFTLGEQSYIVDMPGYGYARAERSHIEAWQEMIGDYLTGRAVLARVFLLIDARHGIKPNDEEIMVLLDQAAVSFQLVLTKIDKVKTDKLKSLYTEIAALLAKHPAAHPDIHKTSSAKGTGLQELRAEIAELVAH